MAKKKNEYDFVFRMPKFGNKGITKITKKQQQDYDERKEAKLKEQSIKGQFNWLGQTDYLKAVRFPVMTSWMIGYDDYKPYAFHKEIVTDNWYFADNDKKIAIAFTLYPTTTLDYQMYEIIERYEKGLFLE